MSERERDPRIGTVLDGQYRLDRLLGQGGVGAVYAAWHLGLSKQVAVKLLHPPFAAHGESLERFQREARILSGLGHGSFVQVYDFGHAEDGTAYMAMELVDGEPLRTRLQRGKPLTVGEVRVLFRPLCEAMDKAHQRGILHRDLKPDNLMLLRGGGVKILDFGMAKLRSETAPLTTANVVMGTPNYLSPERARGKRDADQRSDIFALGAILYEALTGRFAFFGATAMDTMLKVIQAPVPKLGLADAALSARLDEVVESACAKDARDRYPTAMVLWQALEAAICGEEAKAEAPSISSDPTKLKIGLLQATIGYLQSRYGSEGFMQLRSRFGASEFDRVMDALPTSWIEIGELHRLHNAMNALFDDGSFSLMREVGRFFADMALTTTYKSFLNEGGPLTLIRRAQVMYNTISSMGELRVVQQDDGRWCIRLSMPSLTQSLLVATAGWAERYLELAGATNIQFFEERILTLGGRVVGEAVFSFDVPEPPSTN